MRKLIYVFVLIIIVAGIFLYMEQKNMAKHSTIQACENVVQSALKAPDTYSLRTATMIVTEGTEQQPKIIIDFRYKNPFGVETRGEAICTFTQGASDVALNDYLFHKNEWKPNNIKEKGFPFQSFDLNEVTIDGLPVRMDMITPQCIWLTKHRKDVQADELPGKIIGQETPHTYVFSSGTYVYEEKPLIVKIIQKYFPTNS